MSGNKKKVAIISLAVFTVFAVAAIAAIIYLNVKINKDEAPTTVTEVVKTVEKTPTPVKSEVKTPEQPKDVTVSKTVVETPAPVKQEEVKPAVMIEEEKPISASLKLNDEDISGIFWSDHAELTLASLVSDEDLTAIFNMLDGVSFSRIGKTLKLNYEKRDDVSNLVLELQNAIDQNKKDPNFEDFKFVQKLDIYGYECVVTSTDGMTTITYPSDIVPVDFLLYVAAQVADAYPEECSYVTFALDKDLIILSYPIEFTEFDTWLYLDVLAADIPIFASWLYDGTYEVKADIKEEVVVSEPVVESVVEETKDVEPVVIPFTPETELPKAPELTVTEVKSVNEIEIDKEVEVVKAPVDLTMKLSIGYALNGSNPLMHGVNLAAGLDIENIFVLNPRVSLGLGLEGGLNFYAIDISKGSFKKNAYADLTLNLKYIVDDHFSITGFAGGRLFVNKASTKAGLFTVDNFNVHLGAVADVDLRYKFNKTTGFGLDVRYAFIPELSNRAEAKAYISFTF